MSDPRGGVSGRAKLRPETPLLLVVTGVQAAGKSTVGRLLAERFERGVHVEADALLHRMIVSGADWVREPGVITEEQARQLRLRLRNACMLGISFLRSGFTVVLDDIVIGDRLVHLDQDLAGCDYQLIVLAPSVDAVLARDAGRSKRPLGKDWARYLDRELRATMTGHGVWIDSSDLTPDQTVDRILDAIGFAPRATD